MALSIGQPSNLPTVVLHLSGISSETQHCQLLEGQEFGPFRDKLFAMKYHLIPDLLSLPDIRKNVPVL